LFKEFQCQKKLISAKNKVNIVWCRQLPSKLQQGGDRASFRKGRQHGGMSLNQGRMLEMPGGDSGGHQT
jgi:hypothetical protein